MIDLKQKLIQKMSREEFIVKCQETKLLLQKLDPNIDGLELFDIMNDDQNDILEMTGIRTSLINPISDTIEPLCRAIDAIIEESTTIESAE